MAAGGVVLVLHRDNQNQRGESILPSLDRSSAPTPRCFERLNGSPIPDKPLLGFGGDRVRTWPVVERCNTVFDRHELTGSRVSPSGAKRDATQPSRPGEFHPEPLTEPDLNLSIHPARATH